MATNYEINSEFCKSPGVANNGTRRKIHISLNMINTDKTNVVIFGSHNNETFLSIIYVTNVQTYNIYNIVGSLTIEYISSKDVNGHLLLIINTSPWGTVTALATVPINYIKFND